MVCLLLQASMNMGAGDKKELPKDEAALYAQVQALLHQQQHQAVAAQQIQVHHLTPDGPTEYRHSLHRGLFTPSKFWRISTKGDICPFLDE